MKKDGIIILHNKKLFWIIIILIILFIGLIYFIAKNNQADNGNADNAAECQFDTDCVAATCCHADKCITLSNKPDCKAILCSMDCSGPLDCGAGYCGCVNGKCSVVSNNK